MKLLTLIILAFLSFSLLAKEERIQLRDDQGGVFKIGLDSYYNSNGVLEVRVDAAGIPKIMDKLNPTIAFGRDLDDNQKIDTWFFITKNGIEVEVQEGSDPLGRDVLLPLLIKKHQTSAKLYLASATSSVLSFLLMSASEVDRLETRYIHDWIDLEEIKIRLEKDLGTPGSSVTGEQLQFQYELLSLGYRNLANNMESFLKKDFWGWASADVALWLSGSIVVKWAGAILIKTGLVISENALFVAVKEEVNTLLGKHLSVLKEKMNDITLKLAPVKEKGTFLKHDVAFQLSKVNLRSAMTATIVSSVAKKRLLKALKATIIWPRKILAGAASEWKYIAFNSSIQITAETAARWDEVYDANPLVMARNILTNEDIQQNVGFMTADTVLMTGLSKSLKGTKARFLASGFVGLTDSTLVNVVIKQGDNYKRIALDTGWESIIGNAQVQLDLKALETFEKMAEKNKNPKLKLLGYVVALVNQGTGYFIYSKASNAIKDTEAREHVDLKLIPVLAEH